ncbi:hypothetical protein [Nocardia sp. NPDC047038]|uniref:hypothetical protein n=1 Tax=Nocardia sp. NPDC047038 TaxID=3154338 RepID=UPI0033F043EC
MSYSQLLAILARLHPAVWDAIVPHSPARRHAVSTRQQAGPNPQPLPPGQEFLIGAAELAHDLVRTATSLDTAANAEPDVAAVFISAVTDEWCGTPWPAKWPLPWPGPFPAASPDGTPGPVPDPWEQATARAIAATIFASTAARLGTYGRGPADNDQRGSLGFVLAEAADRLASAALNPPSR